MLKKIVDSFNKKIFLCCRNNAFYIVIVNVYQHKATQLNYLMKNIVMYLR